MVVCTFIVCQLLRVISLKNLCFLTGSQYLAISKTHYQRHALCLKFTREFEPVVIKRSHSGVFLLLSSSEKSRKGVFWELKKSAVFGGTIS